MPEDEDRRREHLIAIGERLAVVQHQLAEVANTCRARGDQQMAILLDGAATNCASVASIVRAVLDGGMLPSRA